MQAHIPYRNQKLTMLMSDSLGGSAKTLMFVNVSPTDSNLDETQTSLAVRLLVGSPKPTFALTVTSLPGAGVQRQLLTSSAASGAAVRQHGF